MLGNLDDIQYLEGVLKLLNHNLKGSDAALTRTNILLSLGSYNEGAIDIGVRDGLLIKRGSHNILATQAGYDWLAKR